MSARKYLKGGLLLTGGSMASAVCSFARNIIIARLISVEDFGIAATFAMTMSLIEMASNLALDRMIVQAPDGDDPRMLATAHAFQVLRGAIASIVLFSIAGPVAGLFDIPEVTWAFRVLAVVPLLRSFAHLDMARLQRDMRFGASVWVDVGPQLLVTALAAPLALWLGDYRVMLFVVLLQVAMMTTVSHLVAERTYQWAWDRTIVRRMLTFGWPLLINGFLMFAIFQGDKAIVGAAFTMEELGWYAAAFGLAMMPSLVLVKVLYPFLMPLLARVQDDPARFQQRSVLTVQLCILGGVLMGLGFAFAGPSLLLTVYGERYAAGVAVIGWLGVMQGARIAKAGPAIVAMSQGQTTNPLYANLVRCIGIILALMAIAAGLDVVAVAVSGLIGEVLAALSAIVLLRWRLHLRIRAMLACLAASAALLASAKYFSARWFVGESPWLEMIGGSVMAFALSGGLAMLFPEVLLLLRRITREARGGRGSELCLSAPAAHEVGDSK